LAVAIKKQAAKMVISIQFIVQDTKTLRITSKDYPNYHLTAHYLFTAFYLLTLLLFYIELPEKEPRFDPSMMVYFRSRFTPAHHELINAVIIEAATCAEHKAKDQNQNEESDEWTRLAHLRT
jgi:hypothetical protein